MPEENLDGMFEEDDVQEDLELTEGGPTEPSDEEPTSEVLDQAPSDELIPASDNPPEPPPDEALRFPFIDEPLDPSLPTRIDEGSQTIMINFDGVIHDTNRPWEKREEIQGPIVEGVFKAMRKYHEYGFHIHVCSSRAGSQAGVTAVFNYMQKNGIFKKVLHKLSISDKVVPFTVFIGDTGFNKDDGFPSINKIMMDEMKNMDPEE